MRARQSSTRAAAVVRPAARARLAATAVSGPTGSAGTVGQEDEIELVLIGELPRHERDQLAHRRLGLLGLAPRGLVEMVEGRTGLLRHALFAPASTSCVLRDALSDLSSGRGSFVSGTRINPPPK